MRAQLANHSVGPAYLRLFSPFAAQHDSRIWGQLKSRLQRGNALVANWITNSLAILGLLVMLWARISLGRNIGLVPAQRELVHSGAYAFMRHPVYTGVLLTSTAFVLRAYSPLNVLLMGLGVFWFIPVKSLVEENFLRHDPQYAAYMQKVRARWIPFVI